MPLRQKVDYDRLFKEGRRHRVGLLSVVVRERGDADPPRMGLLVGLRVDKRAVVRNRVKRRLREAWRSQVQDIPDGIDAAFIAQPGSGEATYHELAETMRRVLRKAGALDAQSPAQSD